MTLTAKILFIAALIITATGIVSPPVALVAGIVFGLCFTHPYREEGQRMSKFLLQGSVVALGFGMNLHEVLRAGRAGLVYTALGIAFALAVGMLLGKLLRGQNTPSFLITAGAANSCATAPSPRAPPSPFTTDRNIHPSR